MWFKPVSAVSPGCGFEDVYVMLTLLMNSQPPRSLERFYNPNGGRKVIYQESESAIRGLGLWMLKAFPEVMSQVDAFGRVTSWSYLGFFKQS